jgi:hypothetical protein
MDFLGYIGGALRGFLTKKSVSKREINPMLAHLILALALGSSGALAATLAPRPCAEASNKEGFGAPFWNDGKLYRKFSDNWVDQSQENWCRVQPENQAPQLELFDHRGQKLFLTGVNIGNVQFLPFEGNPYVHSADELRNMLRKAFADLKASGLNSYRFWLHIDGSRSPDFSSGDSQALVKGLSPQLIEDLKWIIRTAYQEYGLLINLNLWSHDILAVRREHSLSSRNRVVHMINDEAATQAYIENALIPLVQAMEEKLPRSKLSYKDAILSWEVFNEPEGVSSHWRLYWNYQYAMEYGEYSWRRLSLPYLSDKKRSEYARDNGTDEWTPVTYKGWHFVGTQNPGFNLYMYKDVTDDYPSEWDYLKRLIVDEKSLKTVDIPYQNVLRFINRVSGAIHRLDPLAKVSTGAHSIPYNTSIDMPGLEYENAPFSYYSDEVLIAAGGDPQGVLDFYQVHGYPEWSDFEKDGLINMFKHPKAHWKLDKPLVVGEHWTIIGANNERVAPHHYAHLYDTGYAGVWTWAYFYVREKQGSKGEPLRYIDKHENQDEFRALFQKLPTRLKTPVR